MYKKWQTLTYALASSDHSTEFFIFGMDQIEALFGDEFHPRYRKYVSSIYNTEADIMDTKLLVTWN